MARNVPPGMMAMLLLGVTTLCFCWQIKRPDGTILGFTDHDEDIAFGGITFQHSTSFSGSAMENQLGLSVSNMDVLGALADDSITEDDLECGRYDGSDLTLYLVDWTNPTENNSVWTSGTLGQVTIGDLAYQAEFRSLSQAFAQYIGSLCSQKCRTTLFDQGSGLEGGCHLTAPAPITATVVAVTDRTSFQVSAPGGPFPYGTRGSLSGGYFAAGSATCTAGANKGVSLEIEDNDDTTGDPDDTLNITMTVQFPDDIAIGDTFDLQVGCDLTAAVCKQSYNNLVNFRGEPYVPGTDIYFHVNSE